MTVLEGDCIAMEVINHDQTRTSVTSQAQTLRSGLKNDYYYYFFFYQLFDFAIKHPFECLIKLFKIILILGEIQCKSSPSLMTISLTYPNLLESGDFLCFVFTNYL